MRGQLDSAEQHTGARERAEGLPTEQLVALSALHDAGHFGAQLARCVGKVCSPTAVQAVLAEFAATNKRRSLNRLPADVLSYVFELSVSRLEEVAPLARVSNLFNACVKRPNVLKRLKLSTHERLKRLFPDLEIEGSVDESLMKMANANASAELLATLQQVLQGYPSIGKIDLGNDEFHHFIRYVTDEHVRLVASFIDLRSVVLTQCILITDIHPLQSLPRLAELNLGDCHSIPGPSFASLSSLTSLQDLSVDNTAIDKESLAKLSSSLPLLTKLNVEGLLNPIPATGFACLSVLTSLQELTLNNATIDCAGFELLARSLTNLTKLHLYEVNLVPEADSQEAFGCLQSLTLLQKLDLGATVINDEGLTVLSRSLPNLTKLDLYLCKLVTATVLVRLSSLTSLQELQLECTGINHEDCEELQSLSPGLNIFS